MFRKLVKLFQKEKPTAVPVYHRVTVKLGETPNEEIEFDDKRCEMIVKSASFKTFHIKVEKGLYKQFKVHMLNIYQYSKDKAFIFKLSPLENSYDKERRKHLYIDPKQENNYIFDIDFYLNKKNEIYSYSFGTRKRFFAFGGEPPLLIQRASLNDLDKVMSEIEKC
jgi:hypothetical protein